MGTHGGADGPVPGSPFQAEFLPLDQAESQLQALLEGLGLQPDRAPRTAVQSGTIVNALTGPLVASSVRENMRDLNAWLGNTLTGLKEPVPEATVSPTMMGPVRTRPMSAGKSQIRTHQSEPSLRYSSIPADRPLS